jgi:hypothetical protein
VVPEDEAVIALDARDLANAEYISVVEDTYFAVLVVVPFSIVDSLHKGAYVYWVQIPLLYDSWIHLWNLYLVKHVKLLKHHQWLTENEFLLQESHQVVEVGRLLVVVDAPELEVSLLVNLVQGLLEVDCFDLAEFEVVNHEGKQFRVFGEGDVASFIHLQSMYSCDHCFESCVLELVLDDG